MGNRFGFPSDYDKKYKDTCFDDNYYHKLSPKSLKKDYCTQIRNTIANVSESCANTLTKNTYDNNKTILFIIFISFIVMVILQILTLCYINNMKNKPSYRYTIGTPKDGT